MWRGTIPHLGAALDAECQSEQVVHVHQEAGEGGLGIQPRLVEGEGDGRDDDEGEYNPLEGWVAHQLLAFQTEAVGRPEAVEGVVVWPRPAHCDN